MRTLKILSVSLLAAVLPVVFATPANADPLICVETGAVHVGPYTVDPPDPCLL